MDDYRDSELIKMLTRDGIRGKGPASPKPRGRKATGATERAHTVELRMAQEEKSHPRLIWTNTAMTKRARSRARLVMIDGGLA